MLATPRRRSQDNAGAFGMYAFGVALVSRERLSTRGLIANAVVLSTVRRWFRLGVARSRASRDRHRAGALAGAHVTFRRDPGVRRLLRDALDESSLAPRKGG